MDDVEEMTNRLVAPGLPHRCPFQASCEGVNLPVIIVKVEAAGEPEYDFEYSPIYSGEK